VALADEEISMRQTRWSDYRLGPIAGGGDGDGDDAAAMAQWADNAQPCWSLEAWHKSPRTMQAEASMMNHAAYASVAEPAKRHNQPQLPPNRMRLL
jgi:hypothetical protein